MERADRALIKAAERIVDAALVDPTAWERLALLCDQYPGRLCGSTALEGAVRWVVEAMAVGGLENVHTEPVTVPHWVRGRESAELVGPAPQPLVMLGLGGGIRTPPEGITAEVLVVKSFDELEVAGEAARGKIVLFNAPFTTYGATVAYRVHGPAKAARQGAVAALVRSVGPSGLRTPHTGALRYEAGVPPIPAAAITIEDAEMLHRRQRRGEHPRVRLYIEARTLPDAPSANVIAELRGREKPAEIVLIGAHLDAWDVGAGAMDDGAGCAEGIAWSLEQIGVVAGRYGDPRQAAQWLGAAAAAWAQWGKEEIDGESSDVKQAAIALRARLGPEAWESAWQAGRAMPQAAAIASALGEEGE
jgi:carboxypeptidase Q